MRLASLRVFVIIAHWLPGVRRIALQDCQELDRKARFRYTCPCRRGVAQLGSALEWGSRGRAFESPRPDYQADGQPIGLFFYPFVCRSPAALRMTMFEESHFFNLDAERWEKWLAALSASEQDLVKRVRNALPIAADLSRSDVFLFAPQDEDFCVLGHARSHAMATLYDSRQVGRCFDKDARSWLWQAVHRGVYDSQIIKEIQGVQTEVKQQVWPVLGDQRQVIAAVGVFTNVVEIARHKRRSQSFQRALAHFFWMLVRGELTGCDKLPPFTEHSGVVFIDGMWRYRYLSGVAANVYRRMGYLDDLKLRTVHEVAAGDHELVRQAWEENRCIFQESNIRDLVLQRGVIPMWGRPDHFNFWERLRWGGKAQDHYGALLLVHDVTEERAKEQELNVKSAMIKEVHHRLKNNLQLLISVLRMQARRAETDEAKTLLKEAMNRLLSMSVIHESLSHGESGSLNLKDVITQIAAQTQSSMVGPHRRIHIKMMAQDDIVLPTNKVTACAMVFNELLLNAVKHGFADEQSGEIRIYLYDWADHVELIMDDTGQGLPEDFSPDKSASIGLDIIHTLVQDDLKGTIHFTTRAEGGVRAQLQFPKNVSGGSKL